jgi:bifunctional ADP-heptose synthase (sugar kinase/adenylyltransferase)
MKSILIVGDWLVDEHWVTGVHRSSTSSRTGIAHYRSLHSLTSTVKSFCGAGQTASLLYNIKRYETESDQYSICGIGLWHKSDTPALKSMFNLDNLRGRTPYRITPKKLKRVKNVKLVNLYKILDDEETKQVCTTRILRIHYAVSSDDVRFERIDWELPPPRHEEQHISGYSVLSDQDCIENRLKPIYEEIDENIDIVVIKDLCKGVVTRPFIKALAAMKRAFVKQTINFDAFPGGWREWALK